MKSPLLNHTEPLPTEPFASALASGLRVLLEAHLCSRGEQSWEFAVELPTLLEIGCTRNVIRWLVRHGHVDHAIEITTVNAKTRIFRPVANLSFNAQSCFVLTTTGLALAREDRAHAPEGSPLVGDAKPAAVVGARFSTCSEPEPTTGPAVAGSRFSTCPEPDLTTWRFVNNTNLSAQAQPVVAGAVPHWNAELRELRLDGVLAKCFRVPAENQILILDAFEEEHWPAHLDDPLPPQLELDPKRRLHDTIVRLNRQHCRLIRFRGDGTGRGLCWERY